MVLNALTGFHVVLSLIGIGSGVVAIRGLIKAKTPGRSTPVFLATTAATSLTGFLFPFRGLTPAQVLGVLSLTGLTIASVSVYRYHSQRIWRRTHAITAVIALDFNVFVLVVQLFRRVPALNAAAPTQSEPPFQIAQLTCCCCLRRLEFAPGQQDRNGGSPRDSSIPKELTSENESIGRPVARVVFVRSVTARDAFTARGD